MANNRYHLSLADIFTENSHHNLLFGVSIPPHPIRILSAPPQGLRPIPSNSPF